MMDVAVVGSGMAGLTAAQSLVAQGAKVTVLDKARGPGGRMSTRRDGECRFDHGAQYFTARDPAFVAAVEAWEEAGVVERWQPRLAVIERGSLAPKAETGLRRYVGVPTMSALPRHLAAPLPDCRFAWPVARLAHERGHWHIHGEAGDAVKARALLLTAPPAQTQALLHDVAVEAQIRATLAHPLMEPCWALMVLLDGPLFSRADGIFVNEGAFSWIAAQASKPARPGLSAWVLHATTAWSRQHLERDAPWVEEALWSEAQRLPGAAPVSLLSSRAHRWRFSRAAAPLDCGALVSSDVPGLAIAGDWAAGSRVEGAFLSGRLAAQAIGDFLSR